MAFRASNVLPSDAYLKVKRAAVQLKLTLQGNKAQLAANGADYEFLQRLYLALKNANNYFSTLKTTPGLAAYAKDQESDQAYDVAAEFTAMQTSLTSAMTWMESNVPTNVTTKPVNEWGDGVIVSNTFTPAQTAGLQTALQGVIDEIA